MVRIFLSLLLVTVVVSAKAQYIEFGGCLGGSTYQGDISYFSSRLSFQGAKLLNGVHIGYHFNDYLAIKVKFNKGSIAANDYDSVDEWRKRRNLHFKTDITEFALIHEIELLDILKFFQKFSLKPYINFGIAWFKFNPQAKYGGQWYDLQPLSTEGQDLPGSKTKPYALSQFSIPFGFGLKYHLNENFYFGLEISPRITFTDYLDDVSSEYPDFELLRQYKGDLAVQLSYQGDKRPGGLPISTIKDEKRGNNKDNDWYIFNSFIVGFKFDPVEHMKRKRNFRYGRKCNFF